MDDAVFVEIRESGEKLIDDGGDPFEIVGVLAVGPQIRAFEVFHREVEEPGFEISEIVYADEVRMLEFRKGLEFLHQGRADARGIPGDYFEREDAIELRIEDAIDLSESALAYDRFDSVSRWQTLDP
jgi:hypothetical protein